MGLTPSIAGLARSALHGFSKDPVDRLTLLAGVGVVDDAHAGVTVQHLSRVRKDPTQPNLRQVHLIHAELFDELRAYGFELSGGELGENVLTRGIDLLSLGTGTHLAMGGAILRVTGLRNPCAQIDAFRPGLLAQMARRRADGSIERRCGIMAVVEAGGVVTVGDAIDIGIPNEHRQLEPV